MLRSLPGSLEANRWRSNSYTHCADWMSSGCKFLERCRCLCDITFVERQTMSAADARTLASGISDIRSLVPCNDGTNHARSRQISSNQSKGLLLFLIVARIFAKRSICPWSIWVMFAKLSDDRIKWGAVSITNIALTARSRSRNCRLELFPRFSSLAVHQTAAVEV